MLPSCAATRSAILALALALGAPRVEYEGGGATRDDLQRSSAGAVTLQRIYRVTAYCDRGTTASGTESGVGQCAAPSDVPFGSKVYIPELDRTFVATDRTAKRFRHNTIDLFMPTREECLQFGRRYLVCEVTPAAR